MGRTPSGAPARARRSWSACLTIALVSGFPMSSVSDLRHENDRHAPSAISFAAVRTASTIAGVSLPVNVFCWLTW